MKLLPREMGGCSFIFAVSIISNTKYSEDIGRETESVVRSVEEDLWREIKNI